MKKKSISITEKQYGALAAAYRHFNSKLFDNQLPDALIILSRKSKKNYGHFHAKQYLSIEAAQQKKKVKPEEMFDELSLNPDKFLNHPQIEMLQTLVHEMAHSWQRNCCEKQPRGGYHDKVWGAKMEEVGLMPSNTGAPGGKKTGQQMMDYVIAGGKFEKLAIAYIKKHTSLLGSFQQMSNTKQSNKNKVKYSCPSCGTNVWGKASLNLSCGDCGEDFEEV